MTPPDRQSAMTANQDDKALAAVFGALHRWHWLHPDHPGPSEMALLALAGVGTMRAHHELLRMEAAGVARVNLDRVNPLIRRWQLTRRPRR